MALVLLSTAFTESCYRNDKEEYKDINSAHYYYKRPDGSFAGYNPSLPLLEPVYKDGKYEGMIAAVYNNLEYPAQARTNQTEGEVEIWFGVKPNGQVDEVFIKVDIGDGCGEAAATAVKKAMEGTPFEPTGVNYDVYGVLEIDFELF